MNRRVPKNKERETNMDLRQTPPRDIALLALAVIFLLAGAVTLVGGWVAAGIAIPMIAVGIALVVLTQHDIHRQHAKDNRSAM